MLVVMRGLRVSPRAGFAATALLGFTTPLWVYAKSFMAEPVEALGLLLALAGAARAGAAPARPEQRRGEYVAALGAFPAIPANLGAAPMLIACLCAGASTGAHSEAG